MKACDDMWQLESPENDLVCLLLAIPVGVVFLNCPRGGILIF